MWLSNQLKSRCDFVTDYRLRPAPSPPPPSRDSKVRKSVERILTIWDERSVYPEELISELRAGVARKAPPSAQSSGECAWPRPCAGEWVGLCSCDRFGSASLPVEAQ